jgi:hypothetical protein
MAAVARRIPLPADPVLAGRRHDYADAFEIELEPADVRTAEELARSCLEGAPAAVRGMIWQIHRHVLRFRLGPRSAADRVLGWAVTMSEPDVVCLAASGPLVDGRIVGRRTAAGRCRIITAVTYRHPAASAVMKAVAPVHRRTACLLLGRAVAATPTPSSS